jgi:hypothetical protein
MLMPFGFRLIFGGPEMVGDDRKPIEIEITLVQKKLLGRTHVSIVDFRFGARTETGHEMALDLVSGVDFRCALHHVSILPRSRGLGAKCGQKTAHNRPKLNSMFWFPNMSPIQKVISTRA